MIKSFIDSPIGILCISSEDYCVTGINFSKEKAVTPTKNLTEITKKCERQLKEYFSGKRKKFDLKINPKGTEFQKRVWKELIKIPYGKTASYSEIAKRTGNVKAARAVGLANNRNPIAIIIPCHRVIGKNGSLTGYAGGLKKKKFLLEIESK